MSSGALEEYELQPWRYDQRQVTADHAEHGEESRRWSSSAESMVTAEEYHDDGPEASTRVDDGGQLEENPQLPELAATSLDLRAYPITTEHRTQREETQRHASPETSASAAAGPSASALESSIQPRRSGTMPGGCRRFEDEYHTFLQQSVKPRASVKESRRTEEEEGHQGTLKQSVKLRASTDIPREGRQSEEGEYPRGLKLDVRPRASVHSRWHPPNEEERRSEAKEYPSGLKLDVRPRASVNSSWHTSRTPEEHPSQEKEYPGGLKLDVRPRASVNSPWHPPRSEEEHRSASPTTLELSIQPRESVDKPWRPRNPAERRSGPGTWARSTQSRASVGLGWSRRREEKHRSGAARPLITSTQTQIARPIAPTTDRVLHEAAGEDRHGENNHQRRHRVSEPVSTARRPVSIQPPLQDNDAGHPPGWVAHPTAVHSPVALRPQPRYSVFETPHTPPYSVFETHPTQGQVSHQADPARSSVQAETGRRRPPGWVDHPTTVNKPVVFPPQPWPIFDTSPPTQTQCTVDTFLSNQQYPTIDTVLSTQLQPPLDTAHPTQLPILDISRTTQPSTLDSAQTTQLKPTHDTSQATQAKSTVQDTQARRPKLRLDTALASRDQKPVGPPIGAAMAEPSSSSPSECDMDAPLTPGQLVTTVPPPTPKGYKAPTPNAHDLEERLNDVLAERYGKRYRLAPRPRAEFQLPGLFKPRTPEPREDEDKTPLPPMVARQVRYHYRPGHSCQHQALIRNYPAATGERCDECGGQYRYHWTCVADTEDFAPREPPGRRRADVSILAEWIIKDIQEGEYTDDQIDKMIDQKLAVRAAAARDKKAQSTPPRESSSSSSDLELREALLGKKPTAQENMEAFRARQQETEESYLREAMLGKKPTKQENMEDVREREQEIDEREQEIEESRLREAFLGKKPTEEQSMKAFRAREREIERSRTIPCQKQVCPPCHPHWVERGWESIDRVVNEPFKPLPNIPEYVNRPIVYANVLRNAHWEDRQDGKPRDDVRREEVTGREDVKGRENVTESADVTERDEDTEIMEEWWSNVTREWPCIELTPVREVAERMGLSQAETIQLVHYLRNGCATQRQLSGFIEWFESAHFTSSQRSHFFRMLPLSRLILPRYRDYTPMDFANSRQGERFPFPVFEETEIGEGQMVQLPGFEFLLEDTIPGATSDFTRFLQARAYRGERNRACLYQHLAQQEPGAPLGG